MSNLNVFALFSLRYEHHNEHTKARQATTAAAGGADAGRALKGLPGCPGCSRSRRRRRRRRAALTTTLVAYQHHTARPPPLAPLISLSSARVCATLMPTSPRSPPLLPMCLRLLDEGRPASLPQRRDSTKTLTEGTAGGPRRPHRSGASGSIPSSKSFLPDAERTKKPP